jgi:hypothetical protein
MIDLLETEKSFLVPHIKMGGVAVDFTMGTGGDTLWLSQMVGAEGKVFAFDIQQAALDRTRARLVAADGPQNWTLILDSHANVRDYVREPICVGMFNLGYLPGSDHKITTLRESTRAAILAGLDMLALDGALLIAVYPGHEEGELEGKMIAELLAALDKRLFMCVRFQIINSPGSPFFFLVEKGSRWGKGDR